MQHGLILCYFLLLFRRRNSWSESGGLKRSWNFADSGIHIQGLPILESEITLTNRKLIETEVFSTKIAHFLKLNIENLDPGRYLTMYSRLQGWITVCAYIECDWNLPTTTLWLQIELTYIAC